MTEDSKFTKQGVAMLSSVLNSERAIQVNIAIMRTFNVIFDAIRKLIEPQVIPPQRRIGFR